jgi:NADH-quinone oxidoreductase subunit C
MESPEQIATRITAAIPGAEVAIVANPAVPGQSSLLLGRDCALSVARFLRNDPALGLDYCSNVTGVDWPGYLEAVYHLYSMSLKHGPVVIRMRTADRAAQTPLPSLTPVWKSAELQEREAFDLYGIHFDGHPDLRRILMWDEFKDYPMRKDYKPPDDYEYEPIPRAEIVEKAARQATTAARPFSGA